MNAADMTKGKPMKLLFLFSLPLMFGNVFQQLYTVVDTMILFLYNKKAYALTSTQERFALGS